MQPHYLRENLTFDRANIIIESDTGSNGTKFMYMKGIFIQGGVKNANERIYPVSEIERAVEQLNRQINEGHSVLGEVDHPDDLKINLDRVSHMITSMWTDGPNGFGKLKILPTPMGQLVQTMLESGVKLGVSSRGSGNVDDGTGKVSDFEIVTVDVVAQPSAPNAYPKAIYENFMNMRYGHRVLEDLKGWDRRAASDSKQSAANNKQLDRHVRNEIKRFIDELGLKR